MMKTFSIFLCTAVFLFFVCATVSAQTRYSIVDLGTLGGAESDAQGLNAQSQVTGTSDLSVSGKRAYLWQNGTITNLGTLGGHSYGMAINDLGHVAGWYDSTSPKAFVWDGTTLNYLGSLGGDSYALDINNSGQIVGRSENADMFERAYIWEDGTMTELPKLAGDRSRADNINSLGVIVGACQDADNHYHACVWDSSGVTDLGTLGGDHSYANSINDSGLIVGRSDPDGTHFRACYWDETGIHELGVLEGTYDKGLSFALAVNNSDQIVGWSYYPGSTNGDQHAFLWQGDEIIDLYYAISPEDRAEWDDLWTATDINDAGQIVGFGYKGDSHHAFLLTPIPEPGTLGMIASGLMGLAVLARRNRKSI